MKASPSSFTPRDCNCLALREASRAISKLYDEALAPSGLRTTQYTLLITLNQMGSVPINALAERLSLDRTTAGKNIRPLERSGLIRIRPSPTDGRSRDASITAAGLRALKQARPLWIAAQDSFEQKFGKRFAAQLRETLHALSA